MVFNDSDKVGSDVVRLPGCPQSCVSNPVESLLEVYEYMGKGIAGAGDISHRGFLG